MRIVQLGPVPPPHGGVQANMSAIAERLRARGHFCAEVSIIRVSEERSQEDVFYPRSVIALIKLLFQLKPDLIHLHFGGNFTLRLAALAMACAFVPRAKTVLTFHSGGFAGSDAGKKANQFEFRSFAVRRLDQIIAVNAEIVDLFQRYGVKPGKITVVAPHVLRRPDPQVEIPLRLKDFVERHSPLLLTTSWLEKHYDVTLQIRVLELIKGDFPNAGLLVAGSGVLQTELQSQVDATNYADSVLLAGDIEHAVVLHLIERADVLLRTTLYDGDAISVREAIFLNTPVVASDNKMRPENVNLFETGNLSDLHRAIDETLRIGKPPQATETADGWKNIDAILRLYAELLRDKKVTDRI